MLHPITAAQFERVKRRYPAATIEPLPSGAALVTLPDFPVSVGWSAPTTIVRFLVPVGYPGPQPDCFWASIGLRLANGQMPHASNEATQIPETQFGGLWFSWHVTNGWNPARDDLNTWISMITSRFDKPQ
jgi:hypothetical protein